jgi:transketolase
MATPSTSTKPSDLRFDAKRLRATVLRMAFRGATVHIACAFSIIELLAVLYRNHLRGLERPGQDGRDFLVLSKGHGVMAQYACLYELGWLKEDQIENYFGDGTLLKGLSDVHVPGLETSSGSLGHGISVGAGLALGAKINHSGQRVYAIIGDGEANEGTIWESMLFAAHWKLDNFIVILDANGFQAMGKTDDVMNLGNIAAKFEAFGFDTLTVDGHDESAINDALTELKSLENHRPKAIVANTIKGKGVRFMEHDNIWHYTRLNKDTFNDANSELHYGDEK